MVLKAKTPEAKAAATETKKGASFEGMDDSPVDAVQTDAVDAVNNGTSSLAEAATPGAGEGAEAASTVTVGSEAEAAAETRQAAAEAAEASRPPEVVIAATQAALAIVEAHKGAVAVSKKFIGALADKENVFDPAALDFNTFPRITVGLDGFSMDDGTDLGKTIAIEVMSFNDRWVASPGTDDEEAKKHVRYSLDGKTIDSTGDDNGQDIFAHIDQLKKVHGYEDAGLKKYQAVYGFLCSSNDEEIPAEDREIVGLQVPPQSRALFDRYRITQGVKIQRKLVSDSDIVICRQEKKTGGTKKFALINFAAK